ncbi:GATOR complex protein WDR59 isoform X4 [Octopus sinensis]|uniref:GATOR complex protein WDR59 isoform X4 n=1 Tax=Octopus sinensis TaxID=2607531 RepID=A0A7E6EYK9_9MOLL|nr:GATOR complex protein WDR59 isoform X4 [Octopus sinensis]
MSIRWSIEQNVKDLKDLQASTMAVDCLGQWVLLGGKRALTLMSLENHDHVRKIDRNSKYDISCVQWNPHAVAAEKFAVACGQKLDVYHWQDGSNSSKPICSIKAHSRVVSDLDWSPFDVNILASCSVDSYTFLWDIREPKKPTGSFQTVAGASQVQWNKVTNNTFATTHEGDVRIWDPRKGNTAVQYIAAHPSKIYGLDWSPFSEYNLATCSQDCTVKFWDVTNSKRQEEVLVSGSPVWKARYTPFQIGLVTLVLPQLTREPYLYLWNISNLKQPVHTFVGHADVVLDFHWRNKAKGSNDYQLVTWSKDQSLRIWKIDSNLQKLCRQDAANFMDDNIPENLLPEDDEIARVSVSAGTREPSFTSIFHQPQTLLQEFSLVNKDIPRVAFEKMDADSRTCTVSAVSKGHCASLVVTFPVSYPNNAAPTFQFTQRTTLQTSQKNVLLQALEDTSQQHVKRNRSCLEPCLRQLTANLDKLTDVEHQTPDNEDQFTLPTKSGAPIVPNFYYIGHQDSSVPFPRTSGARFCSAGYLVCFGRQASSKKAYTERTPKSLSVLAYLQSGMRSPQSTSSYSVFSRSPPTSDGMFSISNYYAFKEKKRNRSRCRSKDTLDSKGRDSELKKMPKVNPVIIYDVLPLQMLNKQLAENYIIQLNDIPKMCSHNGNAALAVGRKDLVQMWSWLALVAGGGQDFSKDPFDGAPWAQHTFGRKLIKSLLDHYMSIYDIQTCAMLSCLLWTKSVAQQLQQPPHSPKPDKENIPPNSDHSYVDRGSSPEDWNILFLNEYSMPNCLRSNIEDEWPSLTPSVTFPCTALKETCSQFNITALVHTAINLRRSNSWSDSYEGFRFTESGKDQKESETEQHSKNCCLLDPSQSRQYENFKKSYSNILHKCQLFNKSAEVQKHMAVLPEQKSTLEFKAICHYCLHETKGPQCDNCHKVALQCAVCQIGVRGSASFCLVCGHGGHTLHMSHWFLSYSQCPSGCGCLCIERNLIEAL